MNANQNQMKTLSLVPMISVADVERSIAFYSHLGFEVANSFACEGETKASWAWLQSGDAALMLGARSDFTAANHTVLFYFYAENVETAHASLVKAGLNPGAIATPFYAPQGEFELVDPDGYIVMVSHFD